MGDGISRREIIEAVEEIERSGYERSKTRISVPQGVHDQLRREAGLDPSHPGFEWGEQRSTEFWDRRL